MVVLDELEGRAEAAIQLGRRSQRTEALMWAARGKTVELINGSVIVGMSPHPYG